MAERKYEKYLITKVKPNLGVTAWHGLVPEAGKGKGGRLIYLDDEVLPGAFWAEGVWIVPDNTRKEGEMILAVPEEKLGLLMEDLRKYQETSIFANETVMMRPDFPQLDIYKKAFKAWGMDYED